MSMKEVEITYGNLFKLITQEENVTYELEKEYFQSTPIEIPNEHRMWIKVNGLITKETNIVELIFDEDEGSIVCAENHIIRYNDRSMIFAKDLMPGDVIWSPGLNKPFIILDIKKLDKKGVVYDVEVDSDMHLYQCAKGIVHHNTLLTAGIIEYANRLNMKTITIVPSSSLLKQTHDYIEQFEIPVGMFGAGKKDDAPNIVATWQTLQNNKSFIRDFECIIWDECVNPTSMIRMADNSEKRIDELEVGELVKTINEKTRQIENKPIKKIHKNLLKSQNQKMFRITMEDDSIIELTGNHEILTGKGWKRTDTLTMDDEIISLAEQIDYQLIELYLKKKFNKTISEWFDLTPTTLSRWKKVMPHKYVEIFKERTKISTIDELIKEIY